MRGDVHIRSGFAYPASSLKVGFLRGGYCRTVIAMAVLKNPSSPVCSALRLPAAMHLQPLCPMVLQRSGDTPYAQVVIRLEALQHKGSSRALYNASGVRDFLWFCSARKKTKHAEY